MKSLTISFTGNFSVPFTTENHLAGSFEILGHRVNRLQEGSIKSIDMASYVEGSDLWVWVQTYGLAESGGAKEDRFRMVQDIRNLNIPSVSLHLDKWWDLARENQLREEPFFRTDYVWSADGGNQDRFKELGINHYWMPPAVYGPECVLGDKKEELECDVVFVGNWTEGYHPEWPHRRDLFQFLVRSYGPRFKFWPRTGPVRGKDLSDVYASSKVAVGDSCLVGNKGYYSSDRIPESIGRGGFLLHPFVEGVIPGLYTPREHLDAWELWDWQDLKGLIDYYLENEEEREKIRLAGHEHVKKFHTYTQRIKDILETLKKEGAL